MNFDNFKNNREFEEEIESLLGKEVFPVEKMWIINGVENNWDSGDSPMEPEVEPADPISFIEILELIVPNITFLQLKKLEAYGIWSTRVWSASGTKNNHTYIYAEKTLNTEILLEKLKLLFVKKS